VVLRNIQPFGVLIEHGVHHMGEGFVSVVEATDKVRRNLRDLSLSD
jgi:hypothetical protein